MNTDTVLVDVAVKDLSGAALDWAVAKALGYVDYPDDSVEQGAWWYTDPVKAPFSERIRKVDWKPSTDWRQGGPVLVSRGVSLRCIAPLNAWEADCWDDSVVPSRYCQSEAETPLVAACSSIVAAKLGDIVKVPACLVMP